MKSQNRVLVKVYDWRSLTWLVLNDMCQKHGISVLDSAFHWVGGLTPDGHPYIRIDLNPVEDKCPDDPSPPEP